MKQLGNWLKNNKLAPYFVYAIVTLLILGPLLLPGFVLTLDMVFVPNPPLPDELKSSYLFYAGLHWLSYILPVDLLQKIMLAAILLLSGLGAHWLAQSVVRRSDDIWKWAIYFAGLFYMINPFTYSRFMTGQFAVLLGYALLPFFVRGLLNFIQKPSAKTTICTSAWAVAISILSIHTIGLMALLAVVFGFLALWRYRAQKSHILAIIKFGVFGVGAWIAASSYWLVPVIFGRGSTAEALEHFNSIDRQAFATTGDNLFEIFLNIFRLQGFWAEDRGLYSLPQHFTPLWGLLALAVICLVIWGGIKLWKSRRFIVLILAISALAAVILASGIVGEWLASVLPFFNGYREPHKFVALLALAYAIFGAVGVAALLDKCKQSYIKKAALVICLILPFALTPNMLWAFSNQLYATQYPLDWSAVNRHIGSDKTAGKTVFAPWHQYMVFGFSGRIIENPAPKFFDSPIISSNLPEYQGVQPTKPDITVSRVGLLLAAPQDWDFAADLASLDGKYILLAKEYDFADYEFLDDQKDIKKILETDNLILYSNQAWQEGK